MTLGADFKALQWVMNAYTIACTTVLMATGTLADRFGRKRVTLIATVAFAMASLGCGLARHPDALIIARFLQGLAGGAMFLCSVAVLSHQFPQGAARGRAFTIWGMVGGSGLGFGPLIGSWISSIAGWPWVFLIHVPLSIVALGLIGSTVRESRDTSAATKRLDMAGMVTLSLAVFGFSFLITQGSDLSSSWIAAVASGSVVAFLVFLLAEKYSTHPMFDFGVFRHRSFSGAIVGCIGMNVSYWPFNVYLPIYLSGGLGYGGRQIGFLLLAYVLPYMLAQPLGEMVLRRFQARVAIPMGLAIIGIGLLVLKVGSSSAGANWLAVLPGLLLAGLGIGLTSTPVTNTTTGAVPPHRAGMASGLDSSARLITFAMNIAAMGLILIEGIYASLKAHFGPNVEPSTLHSLAEKIAAGQLTVAPSFAGSDQAAPFARAALIHGFGWVMLYGGFGAIALAGVSFLTFGSTRGTHRSENNLE